MVVAVLSDVHGNLAALEAVLKDISGVDEVWSLGDVVGYGPFPNECVDLIRRVCTVGVVGNHDLAVLGQLEATDFNPDALKALRWTAEKLLPPGREYLLALPDRATVDPFTLVHGSPREPVWEYLTHCHLARLNFSYLTTRHCFVGHTHVPLIFREGDLASGGDCDTIVPKADEEISLGERRLIINPGSVGQPRDGNPDAGYMILDTQRGTVRCKRIPYPVGVTQRKMKAVGLPSKLAMRLAYGW